MGKTIKTILLILVIVCMAGCASPTGVHLSKSWEQRGAEKQRAWMVGKWLGESPVSEGGTKSWLIERSADGTYIVTFRNVAIDGTIDVDQEYGDWGISGDVYFTMTRGWLRGGQKRPVRHRESYFDDAYLVRRLTPLEFVYESVASGDVYSVRKVGADFTL